VSHNDKRRAQLQRHIRVHKFSTACLLLVLAIIYLSGNDECQPAPLWRFCDLDSIFGRSFVKWFAPCYRTVICLSVMSCLSVLSITLVYCGQTVGRIKMKLGKPVGLDPGHIVLDGNPGNPPPKGHSPNFWPISVVAKWFDGSRCHLVGR